MPAGGESLSFGPYTVTYAGVAMGIMRGDTGVPAIHRRVHGIPINNTDFYGSSTIDGIYRGGDWFAMMVMKEWKAGPIAAWWPFSTLGLMGVIGRSLFTLGSAMNLVALAGPPAATVGPATLTASRALVPPGHDSHAYFGPVERDIPLTLQLYPYDTGGGAVGWFTFT